MSRSEGGLRASRLARWLCAIAITCFATGEARANDFHLNHDAFLRHSERPQHPFGLVVAHYVGIELEGAAPGAGGPFDVTTVETGREWLLPVNDDAAVLLGFDAGVRSFHGRPIDDTVYRIAFAVGFSWFASANLQLTAAFEPGFYSDFAGSLGGDDLEYLGRAIATYRTSDNAFLRFGVVIDRTFDGVPAYPVGGFSVAFNDQLRFDLLAPKEAIFTWHRPNSRWWLHAGALIFGERYKVNRTSKLQFQDIRAEGGVRWELGRGFVLSATGGAIVQGSYRIAGDKSDQKSSGYFRFEAGFNW